MTDELLLDRAEEHLRDKLSVDGGGYLQYRDKGTVRRLHTAIMPHSNNLLVVDHINGNKLDCRRSNLRYVSRSINAHNSNASWGSVSQRGVSLHRSTGKYRAYITVNAIRHDLGCFTSVDDAVTARQEAEVRLVGKQPQRIISHGR